MLFTILPLGVLSIDQTEPIGWASVNANGQNGTTGGTGGNVVVANNMTELITYCLDTQPLIIEIPHMITITPKGRYINVNSNKTIIGTSATSGISQGGFRVSNQRNVIFRNLTIQNTFVEGDWAGTTEDWDGIQLTQSSSHIWVHHCTFARQGDGAIDIVNGADYVTVSFCLFEANNKVSLLGHSDNDTFTDRYKVTFHHNWFNKTTQRHPRVRFGKVHLFNNYYYDMGRYGTEMGYATSKGYGIGIGVSSQIWSEHNFFEKCVNPSNFLDNAQRPGFLIDNGSHFVQSGVILTRQSGIDWNPANFYAYSLDPAEEVKGIVMAKAGAGHTLTSVPVANVIAPEIFISNFPNPFSISTTVSFRIPEAGVVNILLLDIAGRQVEVIANSNYPEGMNQVQISKGGLRSGVYFLSMEFKGARITRKVVVN